MRWIKCYYALIIIWPLLKRTFGGCGSRADMPFQVKKSDVAPGEFPWQVSINNDITHVCSGTIISEFWVVTAAQCFADEQNVSQYPTLMEAGVVNLKVRGRIYLFESTLLHKGYRKESSDNNIALLKSSEAIQFSDLVQPACFPEDHILRIDHLSNCWIAAWQLQNQDIFLQKFPVVPVESCNFNHTKQILCGIFGNVPEGSNCAVESGDSLVCQHGEKKVWALTGIVSMSSSSCGKTIIIASMTTYISWVIENTAKEGKPVIPTLDVDVANEKSSQKDALTNYTFNINEEIPDLIMKDKAQNTAIILKEGTWDVVFPFCFLVVCIIFWM